MRFCAERPSTCLAHANPWMLIACSSVCSSNVTANTCSLLGGAGAPHDDSEKTGNPGNAFLKWDRCSSPPPQGRSLCFHFLIYLFHIHGVNYLGKGWCNDFISPKAYTFVLKLFFQPRRKQFPTTECVLSQREYFPTLLWLSINRILLVHCGEKLNFYLLEWA